MSKAATVILKNKIDKQHITGRSAGYGQKHIFLPDMKSGRQSHRQKLGNSITFGREINSFKAINHQHSEYRSGKGVSEISDVFRSRFFSAENCKGQKAGKHCSDGAKTDGNYLLREGHNADLPSSLTHFSTGFLKAVRKTRIQIIAGIINPSCPKMSRQAAAEKRPI